MDLVKIKGYEDYYAINKVCRKTKEYSKEIWIENRLRKR